MVDERRRPSMPVPGPSAAVAVLLGVHAAAACGDEAPGVPVRFRDDTIAAGLDVAGLARETGGLGFLAGGLACGDVDGDGLLDLYAVRGRPNPNLLFRNLGDGTFEEVAGAAGVADDTRLDGGPLLFDLDGDRDLDLAVGARETPGETLLFRNRGDGVFDPWEPATALQEEDWIVSMAAADVDRDGDLDLAATHYGDLDFPGGVLFMGDGQGGLADGSVLSGLARADQTQLVSSFDFTPRFADLDVDGDPDLLVTVDFGDSQAFRNDGGGRFEPLDDTVFDDENGMGSAAGDYDGDGLLDWFVTSIFTPEGVAETPGVGVTGNRLYRNLGGGAFEDRSLEAGVRDGAWGWGACFADLDLDGHLDLFHATGMSTGVPGPYAPPPEFAATPHRLFLSNGDGTFREVAVAAGVTDLEPAGGVVCADLDRDGDVDLAVGRWDGPPLLYRNETPPGRGWLEVRLHGEAPNTEAIGARVEVTAAGRTQVREIACGNGFMSQDPAEAHFGLGDVHEVDLLVVRWPGGGLSSETGVAADRVLDLDEP